MDWNRVEGNWKNIKGKVKEQWGKLTDDDLDVINGKRDQLEGKIQARYGMRKTGPRRKSTTGTAPRMVSAKEPRPRAGAFLSAATRFCCCGSLIVNSRIASLMARAVSDASTVPRRAGTALG